MLKKPFGLLLGRVWCPQYEGPTVVTVRGNTVFDINSRQAPLVRDICEMADPVSYIMDTAGEPIGELDTLLVNSQNQAETHLLAPCDLQAIKACGVTFAGSMVERIIEERAAGDPDTAELIRQKIGTRIGDSLKNIKPGSQEAMQVKSALLSEGLWSQYLEVGIGADAEIFSKAQPLSAVGYGAKIGLHPISKWNNPEPEVVLAVSSRGRAVGATLGNDVNLRDIEGRSALLLSKAKDNNASCAIGPFIRLFDDEFTLNTVRQMQVDLKVTGKDGYVLKGHSSMSEISRDPAELVAQTIGRHHQYPDGLMLFLGTLFAPTADRGAVGKGFTHHLGDVVNISSQDLGQLHNTVDLSTNCPPWTFGIRALMTNLAQRQLIA